MSSDSDDDYCYTNSVSILKALTKNDNIGSETATDESKVDFFDSQTATPNQSKQTRSKETQIDSTKNDIIDLSCSENDASTINVQNNNDSCIILSGEDANLTPTPTNLISAIDDILQQSKGGRGGRRTRGRKKSATRGRQTRQTTKLRNSLNRQKAARSQSPDVCLIEDTPDMNEVNYEITVKVHWKSQYLEKITMRRFEKFSKIFEHFADKENVHESRLLFIMNGRVVSKSDTPNNLNLTAASIIEGGILSDKTTFASSTNKKETIELKVQLKERKHPLLIALKPEDKMEVLMCQCAEELEVPIKKLKFYFDGDVITPSDTPEKLEFEGGEVIDCIKKK